MERELGTGGWNKNGDGGEEAGLGPGEEAGGYGGQGEGNMKRALPPSQWHSGLTSVAPRTSS